MKYTAALLLCFFFWNAPAQGVSVRVIKDKDPKEDSLKKFRQDIDFAKDMTEMGILEIRLGELAAKNGRSEDVKAWGQKMVEDHTILNVDMRRLSERKSIVLPTELSKKRHKAYENMAGVKDSRFDKKYMDRVIRDHVDMIDRIRKELNGGNDLELREWAKQKLPVFEEQLKTAKAIKAKLEGKNAYGVSFIP